MKYLKLAKRSESLSWHLNFLLFIVDPKLYDTHELSLTQCSRQELSESTCISLITLPLRRRPLISLAKLTAWKTGVVIRGSPYVKAIVRDTRSSLSRCILRFDCDQVPIIGASNQWEPLSNASRREGLAPVIGSRPLANLSRLVSNLPTGRGTRFLQR